MLASELIFKAIEERRTLSFIYKDKIRVVEVHAYGRSIRNNKHVIRGYQIAGLSSQPLPAWNLFFVEDMHHISFGAEPSAAPREGFRPGDRSMAHIFAEVRHDPEVAGRQA